MLSSMPNKKQDDKKLGRGLSDILQQEGTLQQQLEFIQKDVSRSKIYVAMERLVENPFQPTKIYPKQQIQELALSLIENGFVMPILARFRQGKYEIVSGEKRYQAAQVAGLKEVPVIVEDFDDAMMQQVSLIEQLQKDDITPLEEAFFYKNLIEQHGYSHQKVAKQIGKSRVYVTNLVRITSLPTFVHDAIRQEKVSVSHVRPLIGQEEALIRKNLQKMIEERLSVRQCERLMKKRAGQPIIRVTPTQVIVEYENPSQLKKILKKLQ